MRFYIVFVAAFVAASLEVGDCFYQRINKYLVQKVKNDDVTANMYAAALWLKKEEEKEVSIFSTTPVSDLKQFVALRKLIEEPECDRTDYEIMNTNEVAVNLYDAVCVDKVSRRVDKVLLQIFENHAEICHQVHLNSYHKKDQQLGDVTSKRVATIAKTILEKDRFTVPKGMTIDKSLLENGRFMIPPAVFYSPKHLFESYIAQTVPIEDYLSRDILKAALVANARNDPEVKYLDESVINANKVKLVNKYLIEPCKAFVNKMGQDLFIPASLEAKFYSPARETPVEEEPNRDYYIAWASFTMCRALVENESAVITDVTTSSSRKE